MRLTLNNLVAALEQFPAYYAIDVFADDLGELQEHPLSESLYPLDPQGRNFLVAKKSTNFKLEIFPEQGVARLSKNGIPPATAAFRGGIANGLIGAAITAAGKQKAGLLGGVLLGLLVGARLGGAAGDARRVFALAYDHASSEWRAYDGGLLRWMKDQLGLRLAEQVGTELG